MSEPFRPLRTVAEQVVRPLLLDEENHTDASQQAGRDVQEVVRDLVLELLTDILDEGADNVDLEGRHRADRLASRVHVALPHFLQVGRVAADFAHLAEGVYRSVAGNCRCGTLIPAALVGVLVSCFLYKLK